MVGRNQFQSNEMDDEDFISDLLEREENADENVDDNYNDRGLHNDEDGLQKRTQL